jgi:hypothetical protein
MRARSRPLGRPPSAENGNHTGRVLDSAETGQHWLLPPSNALADDNLASKKGRGIFKDKTKSVGILQRRLMRNLRRKPKLAQQVYLGVAASFLAIGLLGIFAITTLVYQKLSSISTADHHPPVYFIDDGLREENRSELSRKNSPPRYKKKLFQSPLPTIPPPKFDILFNSDFSRSNTFLFPTEMNDTDIEEGLDEDYGGLEIEFFEEDNIARTIYHNWDDAKSDVRSHFAQRDDDVDL